MNKKLAIVILPAITLLLAVGLLTAPVFARNGADDTSNSSEASVTTSDTSSEAAKKQAEVAAEAAKKQAEAERESAKKQAEIEKEAKSEIKHEIEDEIETESQDVLNEFKKDHKEHSQEERKKNCDAAEHGLETKLSSLGKNATGFQVRIDSVLAGAIAYQKDNNITVANFDKLVAAAQAAQTRSASSVSVLNSLNTNLDCSQPGVAKNIAKFKVAATKARADLQAYKTSVKDILKALEAAKEQGGN